MACNKEKIQTKSYNKMKKFHIFVIFLIRTTSKVQLISSLLDFSSRKTHAGAKLTLGTWRDICVVLV